ALELFPEVSQKTEESNAREHGPEPKFRLRLSLTGHKLKIGAVLLSIENAPFEIQQPPLSVLASAVAGESAIAADHSMAGDDHRQWIASVRPANGARAARNADSRGQFAVAERGGEGDPHQGIPDLALKGSPLGRQRQLESGQLPCEILFQLFSR